MSLPPAATPFARDVLRGLEGTPRRISSKYFYDQRGNELFQAIMAAPEYYLTDCEREIFQCSGPALLAATGGRPFDLIELGAGDGTKTQHLIEQFLDAGASFSYRPIDISGHALEILGDLVNLRWPNLDFQPIEADYFAALDRLGRGTNDRLRLVLFPGGNVGNFSPEEAVEMLARVRGFLSEGDLLLTGFDLKKDPAVVLAAYNDAAGHTAAFNLNLLARINRELEGDFPVEDWRHWQTYDPLSGTANSYLVPTTDHVVTLGALGRSFECCAWDAIHVEISQKYSLRQIERMAEIAGFTCLEHLRDRRNWFTDSLWTA